MNFGKLILVASPIFIILFVIALQQIHTDQMQQHVMQQQLDNYTTQFQHNFDNQTKQFNDGFNKHLKHLEVTK